MKSRLEGGHERGLRSYRDGKKDPSSGSGKKRKLLPSRLSGKEGLLSRKKEKEARNLGQGGEKE